jgi:hypothetical protein
MRQNKKSKNNNDMIERIEFINDTTRFFKLSQYLQSEQRKERRTGGPADLVILNIRNSRSTRNTDTPNEPPVKKPYTTSHELAAITCIPHTVFHPRQLCTLTMQSNRLNDDLKYMLGPSANILLDISAINNSRNTFSVMAAHE